MIRAGKKDYPEVWYPMIPFTIVTLLLIFAIVQLDGKDDMIEEQRVALEAAPTVDIDDATCVVWEVYDDRVLLDCRRKK